MPSYQGKDIQSMLDEFGVPVTFGSITAKCMVNDSDEEIASGANAVLIGRAIILRAASGAFPGLAQGASLTVDYPTAGIAYKAVSVRRERPGDTVSVVCARL